MELRMITTSHEAEFTQNSFIKEQGKKEKRKSNDAYLHRKLSRTSFRVTKHAFICLHLLHNIQQKYLKILI